MNATVMIVAGGTGGHVYPGLAVAQALRDAGVDLHWLGTQRGLEARVVPSHGIPFTTIPVAGLRRSGLLRWLAAPLTVSVALYHAIMAIRQTRPQAVLGMGGFVSGPGGLAAWLCRRPLIIHEQNAIPGLTNKLLSRFATRVLAAFPGTFASARNAVVTGNPVRADIAALAAQTSNENAGRQKRILIFGGSRGARALNEVLPQALAACTDVVASVVHQCGEARVDATRERYAAGWPQGTVEVTAFIDDMAQAYATADLVIARAGALTVAEIAACGVASILVPYPYAVDDHQTANAGYLVKAGAAILVPERELEAVSFAQLITDLLSDEQMLQRMAEAARGLAQPGATAAVTAQCLEFVDA